MTSPLAYPFARASDTSREVLFNRPAALERSIVVPLHDNTIDGRSTFGLVQTDSVATAYADYVANCRTCTALATANLAVDTLFAVPFIHSNGFRISVLGLNVTTGVATSVARHGVYECQNDLAGNIYPGDLVIDSGQIDCSTTAFKEASVSLDLEEGRIYWRVVVFGTAACTSNTVPLASTDMLLGTNAGVLKTYLSVAFPYAALPQSFPLGATFAATVPPALFYRYAAVSSQVRASWQPLLSPARGAYSLQRIRLLKGSDLLQAGTNEPYVVMKAAVGGTASRTILGTFDSRNSTLRAGEPYDLVTTTRRIVEDQQIDIRVEQYGWPKKSVGDAAAQVDVIYNGAE